MFMRELLEAYLVDAGYEVLFAANGDEALKRAFEHNPDLVLLDVQMPRMDGYEVCRRLKSNPKTQFTPVVMVTALDSDQDRIDGIDAGADDFLTKPYNSYLLMTRVRSLLRIKQLYDELEERNALLHRVLNRYVDGEVADVILSDPERYLKLGGETRPITVLFADIRGFTAFSERHDAQDVVYVLNRLFEQLTQVVMARKGTLDKYIGDEIMAFFGAPVEHEDDALNALRAAQELQAAFNRTIAALNSSHSDLRLGLGIGLCSGLAAVGNIGSEHLMNYTAIGDVVNTAHRLVEIAKPGQILFSDLTHARTKEHIEATELEARTLPGKDGPTNIFSLQNIR